MAPEKQPALEPSASPQEHYNRTVARLARIQSHLATAPRTGKLRGKVAIITGVGSLKGIGYALAFLTTFAVLTYSVGGLLRYYLPMKVGQAFAIGYATGDRRYSALRRATSLPYGPFWGEPP